MTDQTTQNLDYFQDVKDLQYQLDGSIRCQVNVIGRGDYLPFLAHQNDTNSNAKKLWAQLLDGKWGEIAPAVKPTTGEILESAKAKKSQEILDACDADIVGGFTSNALGDEYLYPCEKLDQANLNGLVTRSLFPSVTDEWSTVYLCSNASGEWSFRQHSADQIQKVGSDAADWILRNRLKNAELQERITAAKSVKEVQKITWSE